MDLKLDKEKTETLRVGGSVVLDPAHVEQWWELVFWNKGAELGSQTVVEEVGMEVL